VILSAVRILRGNPHRTLGGRSVHWIVPVWRYGSGRVGAPAVRGERNTRKSPSRFVCCRCAIPSVGGPVRHRGGLRGNRNAIFRLGAELAVRLPRQRLAADSLWLGTAVLLAPDPDRARGVLAPSRYAEIEVHDWASDARHESRRAVSSARAEAWKTTL
jgi:hypothetical protein